MTIKLLKQQLEKKLSELRGYIQEDAPIVIGVEATNEFKENFDKQTFDGKKWQDVKRRDPNSPWYGHSGQTGKKSESRKTAKILDGETGELKGATSWRREGDRVIITNDKPYAQVHNEGLPAKIYGKKVFQMPKRQFIGVTPKLKKSIQNKIERDITKIINS